MILPSPTTGIRRQRGSTLLVALIMLVLLTLIAISAMKGTTSSIQVVGNAQFREEARAAAQQAIEKVISDGTFMTAKPADQSIDVNGDDNADYSVTFNSPSCFSAIPVQPGDANVPAQCVGGIGGMAVCYWSLWDVKAVVSDMNTGASVAIHQGVKTVAGVKTALAAGCH